MEGELITNSSRLSQISYLHFDALLHVVVNGAASNITNELVVKTELETHMPHRFYL